MWHCIYMKRPISYLNHVFRYYFCLFFILFSMEAFASVCLGCTHTVWCGGCGAVSITPVPLNQLCHHQPCVVLILYVNIWPSRGQNKEGWPAFWIWDVRSESRSRSKQLVSAVTSISQRDRCEEKWLVACLQVGVCNDCCGWRIMSTVALCHSSCNTRSWAEDVVVWNHIHSSHLLIASSSAWAHVISVGLGGRNVFFWRTLTG